MKSSWTILGLTLVLALVGCKADPGILTDDDMPAGPIQPLECDSLPVPNSVFSNKINEVLVFSDSLNEEFDTLLCLENKAYHYLVEISNDKFCQERYETGFSTKWLPAPDIYQVGFSSIWSPDQVFFSAGSLTLDDFVASATVGYDNLPVYMDSVIINGRVFHDAISLNCAPNKQCTFVKSFVFAKGQGLVGIKRQGKWWTKK